MVGWFWSNVDPWGCPGARVMTILVFYVGPHFPNIGDFDVYEGIWRYVKVFGSIWRYIKVYKSIQRYILKRSTYVDFHSCLLDSHMNFDWYAYMRMFPAYLWMFSSHLLPHQPTHIHPERGRRFAPPPQKGGRRFAASSLCGFLSGWMCVGWWGSRCDENIHKYAWNMRMYACRSKFIGLSSKYLWKYTLVEFGPWGMPWHPSYDNFCVICWPSFS